MAKTFTRSDFGFHLPLNLIAQTPKTPREAARLMHCSRASATIEHRHFFDLPDLLRPGDVLVFNDSRVIKARLLGRKATGGAVEVFLLHPAGGYGGGAGSSRKWEALVRGKVAVGTTIDFGSGYCASIIGKAENGTVEVALSHPAEVVMTKKGHTPIPPYISKEVPLSKYQTVFAKTAGSVAAPTAGLHFSKKLLGALKKAGVQMEYVTLHVGAGTFLPVKTEDLSAHQMHSEYGHLSKTTAERLNRAKKEGRRIIAVGTTATRTLESSVKGGRIAPFSGWTDIFITPGYKWRAIDGLITNFHLPHSTLLMLVSALLGFDQTKNAYREAVKKHYRFFSFGDGMFIE